METIFDVLIVGAGASGLACALTCARAGKKTLVLEKQPLPARKVLASGNGRCNFTNRRVAPEFYHADNDLIKTTLAQFSAQDCLDFFTSLGVLYQEEENGRFFPRCGKSSAIAAPLKLACEESGVQFIYNCEVLKIKKTDKIFTAHTSTGQRFEARKVVLACGSRAYPQLGGSDSGYALAQRLGHTVTQPRPALSGVCVKQSAVQRLAGVRAQVRVTAATTPHAQAEGEIIFTDYGINGPAILNLSGAISRALDKGEVALTINFLPDLDNPRRFFEQRLAQFSRRTPKDFLSGLLHETIANLLIDFAGLRKNKPLCDQPSAAFERMVNTLLAWPFNVTALRPWNEAMAATGGVKTREINYNTFESLCTADLFITGELLDVDGQSGGFNLHFAWASGIIAARSIIKEN